MKLFTLIYLILICLSFNLRAEEEDKVYEQARSALNNGEYGLALSHVKTILKASPRHLATHILMAEILLESGSASAAEVSLSKAVTLGANEKHLMLLFARSYIGQGLYKKALEFLPEEVNDDNLASKIYVLRGDAHLGLRQLKMAQSDYETSLDFDNANIDAKLGLAQLNVNYFKYRIADRWVDEVLESYVPPVKAWNLKASIQQSLGNHHEALVAINKALAHEPNNIQSLIFAATINIELKHYEVAREYADNILSQIPNEPKAEFIKAMIQIRESQNAESNESIEKVAQALNHLPEEVLRSNPSYYYLAGILLFHQQKYDAARQYVDAYLYVDESNINAISLAATIEIMKGNLLQAKTLLNRANLLEADNPKILSMLGMTYFELGEYEKAHFFLERVKVLEPELGVVDTQLAKNYLASGNPSKALEHLSSGSISNFDSTIVALLLVESYIKLNEPNKALSIAEKLAESLPDNANIQHHLGYIYLITGDIEKARKQFELALSIESDHTKSIINLAELDFNSGKVSASIERISAALKDAPQNLELIISLSKKYNKLEKYQESVSLLEKQFEIDNDNEELLKHLIVTYVNNNQLIHAIETLNTHLLNGEKSADLYILLAQLQIQNLQLNEAVLAFKDAIKVGGEKGRISLLIAKTYEHFSKIPEAIIAYKKALAWDENNEQIITELAQLYNADNKAVKAIELIKSFEDNNNLSPVLIELLANAYLRTGQYQSSEKYYKKRIAEHKNDSSIVGLSLVYMNTHRAKSAKKLLLNESIKNPESLLINSALAEIYIDEENWDKADTIYQGLVPLYSTQPAVLNNAAFVALTLEDYSRAERLARQSISIIDNQPDSLDTLGWIYYNTERYDEALPLFRKALAINNSNLEIKFHLALTLKASNREKEAIKLMAEVANSDSHQKYHANAYLREWIEPN